MRSRPAPRPYAARVATGRTQRVTTGLRLGVVAAFAVVLVVPAGGSASAVPVVAQAVVPTRTPVPSRTPPVRTTPPPRTSTRTPFPVRTTVTRTPVTRTPATRTPVTRTPATRSPSTRSPAPPPAIAPLPLTTVVPDTPSAAPSPGATPGPVEEAPLARVEIGLLSGAALLAAAGLVGLWLTRGPRGG